MEAKYIGILNFKNLTIKYDDIAISRKTIRKISMIEGFGIFIIIVALFGIIVLESFLLDIENHIALSIIVTFITESPVLIGGVFLVTFICERFSPRHYGFVTRLMKFKTDEIEVGWLNNRYVVEVWSVSNGWIKKELDDFLHREYKCVDICDKSKPIHMTIDLTKEDVEVIVTNS